MKKQRRHENLILGDKGFWTAGSLAGLSTGGTGAVRNPSMALKESITTRRVKEQKRSSANETIWEGMIMPLKALGPTGDDWKGCSHLGRTPQQGARKGMLTQ